MKKQLLATLGIVLMTGLVFMSCKKDDGPNYPAAITSGIWSGGNGSTGYSCDVTISIDEAKPEKNYFILTLASPDEANSGIFIGTQFTYNQSTGTVVVQLLSVDDSPSAVTLQFNSAGDALMVSFTSAVVNYGTYTVHKVTYPQSIAGPWKSEDVSGKTVTAYFAPYATNGGLAYSINVTTGSSIETFTGTYTYDSTTGEGEFSYDGGGKGKLIYNYSDDTLTCNMPTIQLSKKLIRWTQR